MTPKFGRRPIKLWKPLEDSKESDRLRLFISRDYNRLWLKWLVGQEIKTEKIEAQSDDFRRLK